MRLDDLYKMVAHIYGEQNISRSASATFSHFVEVCGMLTVHDRKKRREGVTVTDALCKALGWYFPLLAKMRVRSVEELIFRKFPYACPYCRKRPHQDAVCKTVLGTNSTVDHAALKAVFLSNTAQRPAGLNEWQKMFQEIYPRQADDAGRSTIGLLEELGELSEAIRVFDKHPKYFAGEAADTFSYLMGIANEHALRESRDADRQFDFEGEFLKRYPGLCPQCGSRICVCPSVPEATVGRMAKELDIMADESLFVANPESFAEEGRKTAHTVLERVGGYSGLIGKLPFDRGDANHALILLCLQLAEAVSHDNPAFSDRLRSEAVRIATALAQPGSPKSYLNVEGLIREIATAWRALDSEKKEGISATDALVGDIGDVLKKIRVLFVSCSPVGQDPLRVQSELRAIRESVIRAKACGNDLVVEDLPAATIDDLRRQLLSGTYEIIHFSGHSDGRVLVFEKDNGQASAVGLEAVASLISTHTSVQCAVLNACKSVARFKQPIGHFTVGVEDSLGDAAAIEFSRGFYDALAAGKEIEFSFEQGRQAIVLKNFDPGKLQLLKR